MSDLITSLRVSASRKTSNSSRILNGVSRVSPNAINNAIVVNDRSPPLRSRENGTVGCCVIEINREAASETGISDSYQEDTQDIETRLD